MKYILSLLFFVPTLVFAHSVPTLYTPDQGAVLTATPREVVIKFSEGVDPKVATLTLLTATGTPVFLIATGDPNDPFTLDAALPEGLLGGVTIVWGVTSLYDGHYTHGAFNFAIQEVSSTPSHGKLGNERQIAAVLFAASCILLVLRIASYLYLEHMPRCVLCVRSYALLELLMGTLIIVLLALSFVLPSSYWEKEASEGGIVIRLSGSASSPTMTLAVESPERLPDPLFEIGNREASVDPMPVTFTSITKNAQGAVYTFPSSVFTPYGNWHVSTTFIRGDRYDAHGAMNFNYPDDLTKTTPRWSHISSRTIPLALFVIILLASLATRLYALARGRAMWMEVPPKINRHTAYGAAILAFVTFCASLALLATMF